MVYLSICNFLLRFDGELTLFQLCAGGMSDAFNSTVVEQVNEQLAIAKEVLVLYLSKETRWLHHVEV